MRQGSRRDENQGVLVFQNHADAGTIFAVRHLRAQGGIIITASHNPPNFNGYKVYDEYGCQLVPELLDEVLEELEQAPDAFTIPTGNFQELLEKGYINIIGDDFDEIYLSEVRKVAVNPHLKKDGFLVVFTPLHGTAAHHGERLLKDFGYDYRVVEEQMVPDPDFRTVNYPNPEDPDAFALAIAYGKIRRGHPACDGSRCGPDRHGGF